MGMFDHGRDPSTDDRTRIDPSSPIIDAFNNSVQEIADQSAIVMRELVQTYGKAAEYSSNLYTLAPNQPAPQLLAGFDLSRMRMLVTTSSSQVVIGKYETTANNPAQGFYLPVGGAVELQTVDDIWVRNADPNNTAYVSVWIEKSAN